MVKAPLPPPARKAPAPLRLPAAARRASILSAALPLFAARGYDGTTTRDLARAAGVTEPILYRHFPSKEALFDAVLSAVEERILARLTAAVAGARDARSRVAALADGLPALLAALADEFRVLNSVAATRASGPAGARVKTAYTRLGAFLTETVAAAGLRRGIDARTAGHLLLEVGLGASLTRPLGVPAVVRAGYGEAALRILLDALTAPRRRGRS